MSTQRVQQELTDEGLVNAGNRSKSASFTDEGMAKALELLKQYGITLERHDGEEAGIDGTICLSSTGKPLL